LKHNAAELIETTKSDIETQNMTLVVMKNAPENIRTSKIIDLKIFATSPVQRLMGNNWTTIAKRSAESDFNAFLCFYVVW